MRRDSAIPRTPVRGDLTYRAPVVPSWTKISELWCDETGSSTYLHERRAAGARQECIFGTESSLTITVSKWSILSTVSSSHPSFLSGILSSSRSSNKSRSVIHSASTPSRPLTCHHLWPPTTCLRSSGPNQSINTSAAALQVEIGIVTGATAAHGRAGTCVFVLE